MLYQPSGKLSLIDEENYENHMQNLVNELDTYCNKGFFESFDNAKIYYEYFLVENPKASIVMVHGYTEFLKKYYEIGSYFMNMGYNIFLYDQRGHGYSHRDVEDFQVTHVDKYEDYAYDLQCFMDKIVKPNSEGIPVNIYSHSMGGAVASLYLAQTGDKIEKTVLSAPLVYPVCIKIPGRVLRFLIKGDVKKNGWKARLKYSSDFKPNAKSENSGDESEARFFYNLNMRINEPRYQNSCSSNRWNYETLGIRYKLLNKKTTGKMNSKILLISAENDNSVKVKPQQKLAKLLGCEYVMIKGARHCLFTRKNENLETYIRKLVDFYKK